MWYTRELEVGISDCWLHLPEVNGRYFVNFWMTQPKNMPSLPTKPGVRMVLPAFISITKLGHHSEMWEKITLATVSGAYPLCFSRSGSNFGYFLQSLTFSPLHDFLGKKTTIKVPHLRANLPKSISQRAKHQNNKENNWISVFFHLATIHQLYWLLLMLLIRKWHWRIAPFGLW